MGETLTIRTSASTDVIKVVERGPQGPAGATGATGPQGPAGAAGASAWNDITGKPSTFTPSAHTHTASDITDLSTNGNAAGLYDNIAHQVGAAVNDFIFRINGDGVYADFDTANLTASRGYTLPDAPGTLALTESADNLFRIVGSSDATKKVAFEVDGLSTATTRTLTVPNASGTIALTSDFAAPPAIGNTTANSGNFTSLTASGQISGANTTASPPTSTSQARGLQFGLLGGSVGNTAAIYGSYAGTSTLGIGIANSAAGSITEVAAFTSTGLNSCSIGSTTANTGAFTTLNATGTTELVNGLTPAGPFRVYNTSSSSNANYERGFIGWSSDIFTIGIEKAGSTVARSFAITLDGTTRLSISNNTTTGLGVLSNLSVTAGFGLGFRSGNFSTAGTTLHSDANDTLDFRRAGNSQTLRLYGTFTSATNYQRMTVRSVKQTLSALSGASATTTGTLIPDGAVVVGVTTRIATTITGASGYQVGDGTDADRWGDIALTAAGEASDNRDWTAGTIECFTAGGEVTLTAKTANFTAGAVEICVFYLAGEAD